jgi:hypothetical protein
LIAIGNNNLKPADDIFVSVEEWQGYNVKPVKSGIIHYPKQLIKMR